MAIEVILVEDVPNLGGIGELVRVKPGYARNFLLPKRLALPASVNNKRRLEHEKRVAGFKVAKARQADEATAKKLGGLAVNLARRVGEQDKLYGSVTSMDIEHALRDAGHVVDRRKILLDEPIKALGVYQVPVRLRPDLTVEIKVMVVSE